MADFKSELRKYPVPRSTAVREHVARWLDHVDLENIWNKISSAGPKLEPQKFIEFIVRARPMAAGFAARKRNASAYIECCIKSTEARISEAFASEADPIEIATILELAANDLRHVRKIVAEFTHPLEPTNAASRKNHNGSQARRAFCLAVSNFFQQNCGKWLDAEVAALVDIAFPSDEVFSVDQVRQTRRPRHHN